MKKILLLLVSLLVLSACDSSDDSAANFESAIFVDDVAFIPTKVTVSNATATMPGEAALGFTFSKGTAGNADYEMIYFKVNYPLNSSTAPNGVYDFGIGVIGETLFAQGTYRKGEVFYSLAGYTVQVTKLGNTSYRIDFQNVQAVQPFTSESFIISGYFEGQMQ